MIASAISAPEINCYEFDKKKRDVDITTISTTSRNILGTLTSMHIRQLVSPFYKYEEVTLKLPTNIVDMIFVLPDNENSSTVIEPKYVETQEPNAEMVKESAIKKKKCRRRRIMDNKRVKQTRNGLVSKLSSTNLKKKARIQETIARICTPTQSSLRKAWTQVKSNQRQNSNYICLFQVIRKE